MKKLVTVILVVFMVAGLQWSWPQSTRSVAKPSVAISVDVSYVTSITTLNFQGQNDQFLARRTSRAEISRQKKANGATYTLSGEGGMRIGREGEPVFYKASPVIVDRELPDDILLSNQEELNTWFSVVNTTIRRLAQKGKHMRSGSWEDAIFLPQCDGFPGTIRAQFWARPLPAPDDRWILITVDSGLLSFEALDQKYKNLKIQGRYRGILAYSPGEDTFLEAAGAFTLYHGEDRFRIEQVQYAADAEGKQLRPVPDLGGILILRRRRRMPFLKDRCPPGAPKRRFSSISCIWGACRPRKARLIPAAWRELSSGCST